ncbi:MAG: CehA/McbA family metallohydrolase [Polyangiaceae bacterium]
MRRVLLASGILPFLAAACSSPQDRAAALPTPCPTAAPIATASAAMTVSPGLPAPAGVEKAEGRASRIGAVSEIPLTGPRVDGKAGDYLIDNGTVAVVVTQEGRISDYARKGTRDEMVWLNPTLAYGLSSLDTPVKRILIEPGDKALRVERDVAGKPVVLTTWVYLVGAELHVETVAENSGDDPALAMTLGERLNWGNFPTWMEGHGWIKEAGKLTGDFLARDGLGTAYAVCSEGGPFFAKFDDQEFAGFFEPARTGESVVLIPAHGASAARSLVVTTSNVSMGDAVMALPCGPSRLGRAPVLQVPVVRGVAKARLQVSKCASLTSELKPFLEYRGRDASEKGVEATAFEPITLPPGCFQARLVAPGTTPGAWIEAAKMADLPPRAVPSAGKLAFSVTEDNHASPARIIVRGAPGTPNPDWGDDAEGTGVASYVIATSTGTGTVPLPAGKYVVQITHGFERTAKEEKVEIKLGKTTTVKAALTRVVDTKGWISADLHLHAVPSSDAPSLLTDRVRSLLAADVEVGVATDHNAVTDYGPAIAELGMKDHIARIIGDEITTRDAPWGHFNAFPLLAGSDPIPYKDTTPSALFAAVHASRPLGKDTIVQVNHPRMGGIGYFELLRFDPEDIPAWLKRSPLADMGFDAMEVFNGDHYTKVSKVEEVMKDWYALLNAGYRFTATGNSDSHRVSFHDAGVPHNLVQVPNDDPAKLDERAFVDAIRHGRVIVTSGPFVNLTVGDKGIGDTVAAGDRDVVVTVDGPPWVEIEEVTLIRRGKVLETFKVKKSQGKRPWTFKKNVSFTKGDWVIAIARGSKPMTYLYRSGAQPFAFTNPVFVN